MSKLVDDLLAELSVSDLTEEFHKQAGRFARAAFRHARAEDQVSMWEERVDLIFSKFYKQHRDENDDAKENDCKAFIRQQSKYRVAQDRLRRAKYTAAVLKAAVKAFEVKGSMLMQLGADRRAEYSNVDLPTTPVGTARRTKRSSDRMAEAEKVIRESMAPPRRRKRR